MRMSVLLNEYLRRLSLKDRTNLYDNISIPDLYSFAATLYYSLTDIILEDISQQVQARDGYS